MPFGICFGCRTEPGPYQPRLGCLGGQELILLGGWVALVSLLSKAFIGLNMASYGGL